MGLLKEGAIRMGKKDGGDVRPNFEDSLAKLEECAEKLSSDKISLEDAIRYYEEGAAHYRACTELLDSAKQKIVRIGEEDMEEEE